jgi:hypothetical protein
MIRSDYIMRMVEMLVSVLKKVFNLKGEQKYDEAMIELEAASKKITGIDLKLAAALNVNDLLYLMNSPDLDAGKCLVASELFGEYGEISELKGNAAQSENFYLKSLRLMMEALATGLIPEPEKYYPRADDLISKTKKFNYDNELMKKLIIFYERKGEYANAENIIFELLEMNETGGKDIVKNFYNRLLGKPDEELLKGNLSKEEIEESLSEIKINYQKE